MSRVVLLGAILCLAASTSSLASPHYASDEARRIVERMVDAHGGIDRWRAAPAIRFDNVMHDNYHGDGFAWWVAHEVIDQQSRKVWQHWPMNDAAIGYDGELVWSTNWKMGNPSAFMVHFFYYFVNLPFITQDANARLGEPGRFRWPGTELDLYEIRLDFDGPPSVGKSAKDYFVLYVHPQTYELIGYQYANGYQPLLDVMNMPPGKEVFGPLWRLITRYERVDGLLFPTAWRTMPGPAERIVGNHVILNIDVTTPFEHDRAARPADADVFTGPLMTE